MTSHDYPLSTVEILMGVYPDLIPGSMKYANERSHMNKTLHSLETHRIIRRFGNGRGRDAYWQWIGIETLSKTH